MPKPIVKLKTMDEVMKLVGISFNNESFFNKFYMLNSEKSPVKHS